VSGRTAQKATPKSTLRQSKFSDEESRYDAMPKADALFLKTDFELFFLAHDHIAFPTPALRSIINLKIQ
jgi:hypothetical protein